MINWLILTFVDVEGRREIRLLIAVVAVEILRKDKAFFCTVHRFVNSVCSFEKEIRTTLQ